MTSTVVTTAGSAAAPGDSAARPAGARAGAPLADAAVALGLLAATLLLQAHHPGPERLRLMVFATALCLPLAWRRRAPILTFAVISAVALAQWVLAGPMLADGALLAAFYTVAASRPRWQAAAAAGVLEIGVLLSVLRYTDGPHARPLGLLFLSGLVTAAGVLGVNVRVRRAYLAEVEARAARLERERDQQARLAVAAERTRIAREMHDVIAHNLSVMIALNDGAALTVARDRDRATEAITTASAVGRAALAEMHRLLGVLRDRPDAEVPGEAGGPAADPAARQRDSGAGSGAGDGLAPAPGLTDLDAMLELLRRTGLQVGYRSSGMLADLEPGLQLTLYRIAQEAVTNIVKHARDARAVTVDLVRHADRIELDVTDDGAPGTGPGRSSPRPAEGDGGHGLIGMRERVALHRGRLSAGPTAAGWRVAALIPLAGTAPGGGTAPGDAVADAPVPGAAGVAAR